MLVSNPQCNTHSVEWMGIMSPRLDSSLPTALVEQNSDSNNLQGIFLIKERKGAMNLYWYMFSNFWLYLWIIKGSFIGGIVYREDN